MAAEFHAQLQKVRENLDSETACVKDLDETIASLKKIKNSLVSTLDSTSVQIGNLTHGNFYENNPHYPVQLVTKDDIQQGINKMFQGQKHVPIIIDFCIEDNFQSGTGGLVTSVREAFMQFETPVHAAKILDLKHVFVRANGMNIQIKPVPISRPAAERTNWRTIGTGIARLKAINEEYVSIGIKDNTDGRTFLWDPFIDISTYRQHIQEIKRRRVQTGTYEKTDAEFLLKHKPVDLSHMKERVKKLFDEECQILLKLREFQMNGMIFDF